MDVGVSIGMQPSTSALLKKIESYLNEGYRRIKIKIKPGEDLELIKSVRKEFPDIAFMVDANSSYKVTDIDFLKKLDDFNLLMIEQPLERMTLWTTQDCKRKSKRLCVSMKASIHLTMLGRLYNLEAVVLSTLSTAA